MKFVPNGLCFIIVAMCLCAVPLARAQSAACSVQNLVRCIDSACDTASEYGMAARCVVCGTTAAATQNNLLEQYRFGGGVRGLTPLSVGYTSSAVLDMRGAPTDPGKRYAWAAEECMKKNSGCTIDDVEKNYDKLMEQSCRAALSEKEYEAAFAELRRNRKTESGCRSDLMNCMARDNRCGANFASCEAEAEFDRNFSACTIDTDCGSLTRDFATNRDPLAVIKSEIRSSRDSYFASRAAQLKDLIAAHQSARDRKVAAVREDCASGVLKDTCVANMCGLISSDCMDVPARRALAFTVCAYVDVACGRIK